MGFPLSVVAAVGIPAPIVDLLLGALDAHLHYDGFAEGVNYVVNRGRSSVIEVFCAFSLYGVGWSKLQRTMIPSILGMALGTIFAAMGLRRGMFKGLDQFTTA